jgi:superoxide dismutase, Cu-Zn family
VNMAAEARLVNLISVVLLAMAAQPAMATQPQRAVAHLSATRGGSVSGKITFTRVEAGVTVSADLRGLSPGAHGLHIHEFGDCSAPDANSAGAHFNPTNEPHGGPKDQRRHVGDLGNIVADKEGNARLESLDARLALEGPSGVIGRSIVVHVSPDDFRTQPTGNTGARLACGVIGVAKSE